MQERYWNENESSENERKWNARQGNWRKHKDKKLHGNGKGNWTIDYRDSYWKMSDVYVKSNNWKKRYLRVAKKGNGKHSLSEVRLSNDCGMKVRILPLQGMNGTGQHGIVN